MVSMSGISLEGKSRKTFWEIHRSPNNGANQRHHSGERPAAILISSSRTSKWFSTLHSAVRTARAHIHGPTLTERVGDWAGETWSQDPTCSAKAPTCQEYVQNNPQAFTEAYWRINALKVYSKDDSGDSEQSSQPIEPVPADQPEQPVEPVATEQPQEPVQVITQVVQGPAVTMTIYARSPAPTPGSADAPVERKRDARRARPRRHLAEHVRSAAGQRL